MTHEEAVLIWRIAGSRRCEALHRRNVPAHVVDKFVALNALDVIDGLVALGLLKVDALSPQDTRPASGDAA